jgi:hypothetical protein
MNGMKSGLLATLILVTLGAVVPACSRRHPVRSLFNAEITIGYPEQVSSLVASSPQVETRVAVDPTEPRHVIVVNLENEGEAYALLVFETRNSGLSWRLLGRIHALGDGSMSDPAVAFNVAGEAFVSSFAINTTMNGTMYELGKFYYELPHTDKLYGPINVDGTDRQAISIDRFGRPVLSGIYSKWGSSKISIRVQVVQFHGINGITVRHRDIPRTAADYGIGNSTQIWNGDLLIPELTGWQWRNSDSMWQQAVRLIRYHMSSGKVWTSEPIAFANVAPVRFILTTGGLPSIAVDRSDGPFQGSIYLLWQSWENGYSNIYVAASRDDGKTWSSPHRVCEDFISPDNCPEADRFDPAIAVNHSGAVGVEWLERRPDIPITDWQSRFAVSLDGSASFSKAWALAPTGAPSKYPASFPIFTSQKNLGGDRHERDLGVARELLGGADSGSSMTADRLGRFWPVWYDYRTGVSQIWTAPVMVHATVALNGSVLLRDFVDVSGATWIRMLGSYMPTTQDVKLTAYVVNASRNSLHGPILLRVLDATSPAGPITLCSPFAEIGNGAVVPILSGNLRGAEQSSQGAELTFRIPPIGTITRGSRFPIYDLSFFHVRYSVLAAAKSTTLHIRSSIRASCK